MRITTTRTLFDLYPDGEPESGRNNDAALSPTQRRRNNVARISDRRATLKAERPQSTETKEYAEGYAETEKTCRLLFAIVKKGKERDEKIDNAIIVNADYILSLFDSGVIEDEIEWNNVFGKLSALADFLAENVPPF